MPFIRFITFPACLLATVTHTHAHKQKRCCCSHKQKQKQKRKRKTAPLHRRRICCCFSSTTTCTPERNFIRTVMFASTTSTRTMAMTTKKIVVLFLWSVCTFTLLGCIGTTNNKNNIGVRAVMAQGDEEGYYLGKEINAWTFEDPDMTNAGKYLNFFNIVSMLVFCCGWWCLDAILPIGNVERRSAGEKNKKQIASPVFFAETSDWIA